MLFKLLSKAISNKAFILLNTELFTPDIREYIVLQNYYYMYRINVQDVYHVMLLPNDLELAAHEIASYFNSGKFSEGNSFDAIDGSLRYYVYNWLVYVITL